MKKLHKLLSVLKNGCLLNATHVEIKKIRYCIPILKLLYTEGYIQNFIVHKKTIVIFFRYYRGTNCIRMLKNFVKPSRFVYIKKHQLWLFSRYNGTLFLSTTRGIITHFDSLRYNLGGKILFFVG